MRNYNLGDIIFLSFPFVDTAEVKRRPALVLLDTGDDDIIVARITSQMFQTLFDVEIIEWHQAGLLVPSVVRLHKIATLKKQLIDRKLGILATDDLRNIRSKVREIWLSI